MPRAPDDAYFLLGTFNSDGQKFWCDNQELMADLVATCGHEGAILGQYAVLGRYDFVVMAEAEDNEAVARLSLEIGVKAGLHIETLPATSVGAPEVNSQTQLRGEVEAVGGSPEPPDQWQLPRRTS